MSKTPREILADKTYNQYMEIAGIIDKYVPKKHQLHLKLYQHMELSEYLVSHTEDEINSDYLYETEYIPKCRIIVTDEHIESGEASKPLDEVCPYVDCPKYDECWASTRVTPVGVVDYGNFSAEAHLGWSDFREWMYENKQPTPSFENKEYEKKFYINLEEQWRNEGKYP